MLGQGGKLELGVIRTYASAPGRGHPPEFWAELAMERIMSVAESAPPPIRDQAVAFKAQISLLVLNAVRNAVQEQKLYDALNAAKVSEAAAQAVREGA